MIALELALWDMLAPIVKQLGHLDMPPRAGDNEGRLVWHCWLESSRDVAQRCFDAGRADMEKFRVYKECKERVIQDFGHLCISAFEVVFIKPLMNSLGLLDKYMGESSLEYVEGRRLSKYEMLFVEYAAARDWQRTVVEEACLENSFDLLFSKIHDVVLGLVFDGNIDPAPIVSFAESVNKAKDCNYQSFRVPFAVFSTFIRLT